MSTVIEAITARHAGMRVCGVSLVTNYAAGIRAEQLNHEEVKAAGVKAQPMFARLVSASIEAMKDI
jgi:purine-nucleoside phosphorylase